MAIVTRTNVSLTIVSWTNMSLIVIIFKSWSHNRIKISAVTAEIYRDSLVAIVIRTDIAWTNAAYENITGTLVIQSRWIYKPSLKSPSQYFPWVDGKC